MEHVRIMNSIRVREDALAALVAASSRSRNTRGRRVPRPRMARRKADCRSSDSEPTAAAILTLPRACVRRLDKSVKTQADNIEL
jgi:hypothetical protein